jgi:hypothetical protein
MNMDLYGTFLYMFFNNFDILILIKKIKNIYFNIFSSKNYFKKY